MISIANTLQLMNSSKVTTEIRQALMTEQYGELKFYIGAVLALASCVTVVGLVATYTAWSMISALSDANSNTMLRSSMGQYVTALPSRFVVASLYLFLLWLTLILIDIVSGPLILVILGVVVYLFFQVVVSLSAFGRLIIHTGAMGKKRILDPDLERQLLPSGLHASLLIKATERSRRRTSVTQQYRPKVRKEYSSERSVTSVSSHSSRLQGSESGLKSRDNSVFSNTPIPARGLPPQNSARVLSADEESALENAALIFGGDRSAISSPPSFQEALDTQVSIPSISRPSRHVRHESVESVDDFCAEINFPVRSCVVVVLFYSSHEPLTHKLDILSHGAQRASILNSARSDQLKSVVHSTLSSNGRGEIPDMINAAKAEIEREEESPSLQVITNTRTSCGELPEDLETPRTALRKLASRRSIMVSQDDIALQAEWTEEDNVRSIYDIEPPVEFLTEDDDGYVDDSFYPSASVLNGSHDLGALKKLMNGVGRSFNFMGSSSEIPNTLNRIRERPSMESFDKYEEMSESTSGEYAATGQQPHRVHFNDSLNRVESGEGQPLLSRSEPWKT